MITKYLKIIKNILSGGIIFSLAGCLLGEEIIDLKTVPLTILEEKNEYNEQELTIKGLVFSSSLGIDRIELHQDNDELNILVHAKPANRERTGNLYYKLSIPEDISIVTFGKHRETIWSRAHGTEKSPYITPSGRRILRTENITRG